ncbi:hypothetical protein JCM3770_007205 [Rhodotorula araucariae]
MRLLQAALAAVLTVALASARPTSPLPPPVPIVIWHGLGDRFDAPGLLSLKEDLEQTPDLAGVFVHIVQLGEDGTSDQRATFFGSANDHVARVCAQLAALPEIVDPLLNPSRQFDALGFSQGGQLLRAVVERCGAIGAGARSDGVRPRRLVTVGSQHMGISELPPCPPNSSPLSPCRLMHLSLVRSGIYTPWAQRNVIPAQYFRDPTRIDEYLARNDFLRDVNNERVGDAQLAADGVAREVGENGDEVPPRNATYKANLSALDRLVLFRFSDDVTVVPPHTAHFTLPSPNATNCPPPSAPGCYATPLPWPRLALYRDDYVGLAALDAKKRVQRRVCEGAHMEIGDECWRAIVRVFTTTRAGRRDDGDAAPANVGDGEVWHRERGRDAPKLVLQL